jgi:hypothetical protein
MKYFWIIALFVYLMPLSAMSQEDKLTRGPDVEFAEKNEKKLFYDWAGAKTNYKWDWLETTKDDATIYRYFTEKNDLMVVQKTEGTTWTQADLPYAPFPPFWYYEATFHNVTGETGTATTGLLLKATSNKEEIKIIFTVNPFKQTYYFGLYNATSKTWRTLNKVLKAGEFNLSDAIQKLEAPKQSVRNKLKIQRSGNNFLLYINFKLVETVKVPLPTSELNKLHGIGIASGGKQGYYIDDIRFSIFTDEGIYNNKNEPGKSSAGQPISKALNKKVPAKISGNISFSLVHDLDANGIQRAKNAMVGENKFSEKDFDNIISRANIKNYPVAINTIDKIETLYGNRLEKAQGYIQGSFLLPYNDGAQIIDLVWFPASDNASLEKDMMPADGGDQFYFTDHRSIYPYKGDNYFPPPVPDRMSIAAENAMKQKHSKKIAENLTGLYENYDGFHAYKPLRDLGYSEEEFVRIMQLATFMQCQPTGVKYGEEYKQGLYTKYKAYRITEFNDGYGDMKLYWVPKEENMDLPKAMHPLTDEGLFLFSYVQSTGSVSEINRKKLANKPTGQYVYPKLAEYTIAKTSDDAGNNGNSNNGSSGGNNGVQKNKKPDQPQYGKYSPDDVYKEEEKLINYLKYNDSQLNPYLDKILRSGKDAWILYKTKEKARGLVDGQINAINAFLKDYGPYTSASFKSDVEGRLATAIGVRGRLN